jgi:hypothetical protein
MEHLRLFTAQLRYLLVLVRSRLVWGTPLYWRMQYRRLARHMRAIQRWDTAQYEKAVNEYEVRLQKEQVNRECAVRCYEALLADRERQIAALAATLREARAELEIRDSLPVHPTEQQATEAIMRGDMTFEEFLQKDFN